MTDRVSGSRSGVGSCTHILFTTRLRILRKITHQIYQDCGSGTVSRIQIKVCDQPVQINYLCTYDLYGPVRKFFKGEKSITRGGWALDLETSMGPVKSHEPLGECHLGPRDVEKSRAQPP